MNLEIIASVIFLVLLTLFLIIKRKNLTVHSTPIVPIVYLAMYRTKLGLKLMDSISKHKKAIRILGIIGIWIGFLGMLVIAGSLIKILLDIIFKSPAAASGVGLVLPIKAKGVFYVPFFYWIISIFILATVHEFSHGVVARAYDLKIKSSGFAFFGIIVPLIPAAFVEPDEEELRKRPARQQLSVFAAGPFANIITATICILILIFVFSPVAANMIDQKGIVVSGFVDGIDAASEAGIQEGEIISSVDYTQISTVQNLSDVLMQKKPGDTVFIETDNASYNVTLASNPKNSSQTYLGVYLEEKTDIKPELKQKYGFLPSVFIWIMGLFFWLYALNIGIGLFNLVPIGPIDGGRMLQIGLLKIFKDKEKAEFYWKRISLLFLMLLIAIIIIGFIY